MAKQDKGSRLVDRVGIEAFAQAIVGSTKTINGTSIWGSGDIEVQGGSNVPNIFPVSPYSFQPLITYVADYTNFLDEDHIHLDGVGNRIVVDWVHEFRALLYAIRAANDEKFGAIDIFIAMSRGMHVYAGDWGGNKYKTELWLDCCDLASQEIDMVDDNSIPQVVYTGNFILHSKTIHTHEVDNFPEYRVDEGIIGMRCTFRTNLPTGGQLIDVVNSEFIFNVDNTTLYGMKLSLGIIHGLENIKPGSGDEYPDAYLMTWSTRTADLMILRLNQLEGE